VNRQFVPCYGRAYSFLEDKRDELKHKGMQYHRFPG
jgi:ribosomal RNA assembly protein